MIFELYHFEQYNGATLVQEWFFTSGDVDISYSGDTYVSKNPLAANTGVLFGRSAIQIKREISKNNIKISFAPDDDFAQYWYDEIKHSSLNVTIYEYEDPDATTIFTGHLSDYGINSGKIQLTFETGFTALREKGPRKAFGPFCPLALYSDECGVTKATFGVAAVVTAISDNTLTVTGIAAYDDGYFTHGLLEDDNGTEVFVLHHAGTSVVVQDVTPFMISDEAANGSTDVTIYPGCQKNILVCENRFSNGINYQNYPGRPFTNPFEG